MPFAPAEGGQIHYQLEGKKDLPVLLLSNSLGMNLTLWDPNVAALTQHYQVLRYDSYGHGESTLSKGSFGIELLGNAVIQLIDYLDIAAIHFCGISVGGLVGQYLALNAAQRLNKVALCSTAARIGNDQGWNARIAAVEKGGISSISDAILERWFTGSFQEREPATVERFRTMLRAMSADSYIATCKAIRDADFRNEISKIRVNSLVVSGSNDRVTPPEDGRYLTERLVGSRYVELDAAHILNVEAPQQFSESLLKFLAE